MLYDMLVRMDRAKLETMIEVLKAEIAILAASRPDSPLLPSMRRTLAELRSRLEKLQPRLFS